MCQITHARAAVFFVGCDAEHTEVAEFFPQIHRELVVAIDLGCARGDFGPGKFGYGSAQGGNVGTVIEGQTWQVNHAASPWK